MQMQVPYWLSPEVTNDQMTMKDSSWISPFFSKNWNIYIRHFYKHLHFRKLAVMQFLQYYFIKEKYEEGFKGAYALFVIILVILIV